MIRIKRFFYGIQVCFSRPYWCLNTSFIFPLFGRMPFPGTDETGYDHSLEDLERTERRVLENIKETTTEPVYTMPEVKYVYEENEYFTEEDAEGKKLQEYGETQKENEENLKATVETRATYSDYGMILEYENLF